MAEPPDGTGDEEHQPGDEVEHPGPVQRAADEGVVDELVEPIQAG